MTQILKTFQITSLVLLVLACQPARAACSAYLGRVVFNEVFDKATTFVEVKTLDTTVVSDSSNFSGWTIELFKNNSATKATVNFGSVFTDASKNSCGTASRWIQVPDSSLGNLITGSNGGSNLNFLLKDAAGDVVDIFRLATATTTASFYTGAGSLCSTIENNISTSKYSAAWGINGNKDWYRTPDGTGNWGGQATAANSDTTCANNDTGTTVSAPLITTVAASSVGTTTATLNGTVNPGSGTTTVSFGYSSTSGSYTSTCSVATTYTGSATQSFACNVTGLTCGTTYYFRASGTNTAGTTNGSQLSFTPACAASPTSFSAYESNISNASAATSANRVIMTRVAGTSGNLCPNGISTTASSLPTASKTCSLTVAGFSAGAVASTYSGSVSVKLQYCTNVSRSGSGATSTVTCGGSWSDLSGTQTVALSSGVGVATFGFVNNAYEVVRVNISSATVSGGPWNSDDNFAIRPTALDVTATDGTSSTAGNTRSLTSLLVTHRAGTPFTLNAQAYVTSTATTASLYPGTGAGPVVSSAITTSTGSGAVSGTFSIGSWSGTGTRTSSTATYTEAGSVSLVLEDQDFANVDRLDGSTTAERYFSDTATSIGRFTPDYFTTVVTHGCSANNFTYSGQPFSVSITARNRAGNVTANYDGSANTSPTLAKVVTLTDANSVAGALSSASVPASAFTAGVATATPTFSFTSAATLPTAIKLRATDTDSVDSSTGNTGLAASAVEGTSTVYSGRVRLFNANGSELLPLPITARVENYFASGGVNGWYTSTVDSCSTLSAGNFAFTYPASSSSFTNNISACTTGISNADFSGSPPTYSVRLKAPGTGKNGATDLTLNLGASATGSACTCSNALAATTCTAATATTASRPWLQFNWTGSTANPTARATFGVSKSGPQIHLRELY